MEATFEFTDDKGMPVTVRERDIIHVARPLGGYPGELKIITGATWGFGGKDRDGDYKRAHAALERGHSARKGES